MGSPHHHLHETNHHCCCCCCSCCTIPSDPLVQAIATQLIQAQLSHSHPQSQHPQHPNLFSRHSFSQYFKQSPPQNLHNPSCQQSKHRFHQQNQQQEGEQNQRRNSVISSLCQRIDALESSLQHFSSSSSSFFSNSLRDRAARTIQTHFRAYLVRRSRTLRQLKDLALIKSRFISLKSSISDQTHFDYEDASQQATDLLLKLDSIQGFDPMIRDGKRSISRELVRFLEFIDGVLTRRRENSRKLKKSLGFSRNGNKSRVLINSDLGGDKRSLTMKLRDLDGHIGGPSRDFGDVDGNVEIEGFHHFSGNGKNPNPRSRFPHGVLVKKDKLEPKMKKSVSFAEDRNVVRAFGRPNGACSNGSARIIYGDYSIDDERVLVENLCNGIEEVGAFSRVSDDEGDDSDEDMENGGSSQISAGKQIPRRNLKIYDEVDEHHQGQNGNIVFSAPMPEKMESRADLIERENVKIELNDGP
ncbi:hypothetical protein RJ641_006708 [Dillenia turbinata]|uniref:BAG domain-containing protein n=1 Tax=Dillenia turbinata TaxID=194707 RepID=A0AAN8VF23_9MAGN